MSSTSSSPTSSSSSSFRPTVIDISHLPRNDLIRALWTFASRKWKRFEDPLFPVPEPTDAEIAKQTERGAYIDYLNCRCMKIDFSDSTAVDTEPYDYEHGPGSFAAVVKVFSKGEQQ